MVESNMVDGRIWYEDYRGGLGSSIAMRLQAGL